MTKPEAILQAAAELRAAIDKTAKPRAFIGTDGFIDEIVQVVDTRTDFDSYVPVRTISQYAARLAQAAGKSTNVELVLLQTKMGGNGPLMADAMGRLGTNLNYVGAVGYPAANPVFDSLRAHGNVVSIANPGITIAAEFEDGKIMHGRLESLNEITYATIVERIGGQAVLDRLLVEPDVVAMVNWTMIPHLNEVWQRMSDRLVELGGGNARFYFFDLCDPQKRTRDDLRGAMATIASFKRSKGTPILGLNEKESQEVCEAMGAPLGANDHAGLLARARAISEKTGIPEIVIHPRDKAVATGPAGSGSIDGPVCASPKLTTGAGDHFNGGYTFARTVGLTPQHALTVGKAVSGFYVREGRGPSVKEVVVFCELWAAGKLDPWERG